MSMHAKIVFHVTAFVAIASTAHAGTVTIDFDTLPGGASLTAPLDLTTEYVLVGALFSSKTRVVQQQTIPHAISQPNIVEPGNSTTDFVTFDVSFVAPGNSALPATVQWVEITQDYGANSGNNVMTAYDLSGSVVDSVSFASAGATFRVEATAGIHRVVASGNDGLDNLRFTTPQAVSTTQVVPLPQTGVLAALGFAFVGLLRRMSRRRGA